MQRIATVSRSLALHGVAASRLIERQALASLPPLTLVRKAGESLGRLALALAPHARRVLVVCGPGNNGADGLNAALWLHRAGKQVLVDIGNASETARQSPETADGMQAVQEAGLAMVSGLQSLEARDIAIDALLGLGTSRAPSGRLAESIRHLNALACPVLAADLPSGLDADTGQPVGEHCVKAAFTLSLLTLHPGLFTGQGRDLAGDVWFDDLGATAVEPSPLAWLSAAEDAAQAQQRAGHARHKGSFGDVAVIGGSHGMTGAPLLAARAAHAAGAGRVYVSLLDPEGLMLDIRRPELMFRREWWKGTRAQLAAATVVCGCGGGKDVAQALPALLRHAGRLVLDADALNEIAGDSGMATLLRSRADHHLPTVLTPHPLEAARLLGTDTRSVQGDRLAAGRALSDRYGCVAVVKGSGTVIDTDVQDRAGLRLPRINRSGNGSLATAGTGDVLAGWLGGIWSRAASTHSHADEDSRTDAGFDGLKAIAARAAVAAVYLHGRAAENSGEATTRAADLVEQLLRDRPA